MSIKTEQITIKDKQTNDDKVFSVTQLPASVATPILLDLMKYLGEPLAKLMNLQEDKSQEHFFNELAKSLKTLETDKIMSLINKLFSMNVVCGEEKVNIDKHFSGDNLGGIFELAIFIIKVNFAGFFSDLTGLQNLNLKAA